MQTVSDAFDQTIAKILTEIDRAKSQSSQSIIINHDDLPIYTLKTRPKTSVELQRASAMIHIREVLRGSQVNLVENHDHIILYWGDEVNPNLIRMIDSYLFLAQNAGKTTENIVMVDSNPETPRILDIYRARGYTVEKGGGAWSYVFSW